LPDEAEKKAGKNTGGFNEQTIIAAEEEPDKNSHLEKIVCWNS